MCERQERKRDLAPNTVDQLTLNSDSLSCGVREVSNASLRDVDSGSTGVLTSIRCCQRRE